MHSSEIRRRFLAFFEKRGHAIIPSASLITPDEKGVTNSTLFNTAGMQPLIPYLLGAPHPLGKRLADSQKCLRTIDIDEVGDKTHNTFFEMLGNWSLGDYFKEDAIKWSYEFLTSKDEGLGLDPNRLYVTVFEGDTNAPRDEEAASIWRDIFVANKIDPNRIYFLGADKNWWEAGDHGPCGPDTEMYYDVGNTFRGKALSHEQFIEADDKRNVVEVWNDVFMQYEKKEGKIIGNLPKPSVDTGAGLERLTMTLQSIDNIYDSDIFRDIMALIEASSNGFDIRSARIISDHLRAATFMISDGVTPSNTDRGYILRRLIRRAIFKMKVLELDSAIGLTIIKRYASKYAGTYELDADKIYVVFREEELKFLKTLTEGRKEFEKGTDAFTLFSSYGFPLDLTLELAKEKGISVDVGGFEEAFRKHQELSRSGAEKKFKGGLADASDEMVVRYHTATHLLHQALHDVLGENANQKGSNITSERLRFDFQHGAKMTEEEKKRVEDIVNEKIAARLPVNHVILPRAEAEKTGARHFFGEKYGDQISIYFIGNDIGAAYSKEFCGGPHVANTGDLAGPDGKWRFKIAKEEAVSQGVRRVKAVLS